MTVCSAQAVAVAIGAGGSGDGVNGRRWRWCRNTQERQLRAPAVVRARLRAAQSGLGRRGSTGWCRQWLWRLRAAASWDLRMLGRGGR